MVKSLRPILGNVEKYSIEQREVILKKQREKTFYRTQAQRMQELVTDIQPLVWEQVRDDFDLHLLPELQNDTTDTRNFHYLQTRDICGLAQSFQRYRENVLYSPTPHILWWRNPDDSNDPTTAWLNDGCTVADLKEYIRHDDTLAIMVSRNTTGIRALKRSKIFPMSQGLFQDKGDEERTQLLEAIMEKLLPRWKQHNRTLPLLIVADRTQTTRTMQLKDRLTRVFGAVKAMYHPMDDDHTLLYENIFQAQFVIGVTAGNHDWISEAIALGAIPILEEDNLHNLRFKNGYQKSVLEELPVGWVDDYSNLTPDLLEMDFDGILNNVEQLQYDRLAQIYWIDRAFHELDAMEAKRKRDEEAAKIRNKAQQDAAKKKKKIFRQNPGK